MAKVSFTDNLQRHIETATVDVPGGSLRSVLEAVFREREMLRGYILDDQGQLRRHVAIFVDNEKVKDRRELSDPVGETSEVFVMQALSGG